MFGGITCIAITVIGTHSRGHANVWTGPIPSSYDALMHGYIMQWCGVRRLYVGVFGLVAARSHRVVGVVVPLFGCGPLC